MASFSLSASTARAFSPTAGRRSSAGRRAARGPVRCVAAATVEKDSVSVVLLAGGVGKRMKADMPKQYLPLLGTPIALYSLKKFAEMDEVGEIVVVCDPSYRDIFEGCPVSKPVKFALPGKETPGLRVQRPLRGSRGRRAGRHSRLRQALWWTSRT